jgi:hypothetical protein
VDQGGQRRQRSLEHDEAIPGVTPAVVHVDHVGAQDASNRLAIDSERAPSFDAVEHDRHRAAKLAIRGGEDMVLADSG